MRLAEAFSGLISLAIALFIFITAMHFPSLPGGMPGPALFPCIISCVLGFFSIILICSGLFGVRLFVNKQNDRDVSQFGPQSEAFQEDGKSQVNSIAKRDGVINMTLIILAMIFFVLFVEKVGFILTGFIICAGLMWRMGVPLIKAILVSTGTVMLIFWLFVKLMLVPLPLGVISL